MIIVISPLSIISNEINHVNEMFENGMDLFHFRKYGLQDETVLEYLNKVNPIYRMKIVLHSHKQLSHELGINRLHFNTEDRISLHPDLIAIGQQLSTSTHSIDEFNALNQTWTYAFLSPTFKSISKPGYGKLKTVLKDIKFRNNQEMKLIGLGGINYQNMDQVLQNGADGIALMGSIWNQNKPAAYIKACKQKERIWNEIENEQS